MNIITLARLDMFSAITSVSIVILYYTFGLPPEFFTMVLALFAMPHFAVTLLLYHSHKFRGSFVSARWRLYFVLIPIIIMLVIFFLRYIADTLPVWIILGIVCSIRVFDAYHVQRQYFGVSLLFSSPKSALDVSRRNTWHLAFALLWCVNAANYFYSGSPNLVLTSVAVIAFVLYAIDRIKLIGTDWVYPYLNLFVVGVAFLLPFLDLKFYVVAILSHYVQYLYLFGTRFIERAVFTESRGLMYLLLPATAGIIALYSLASTGGVFSTNWNTGEVLKLFLIMDGLFVIHYYLDSLIWKTKSNEYGAELREFFRRGLNV